MKTIGNPEVGEVADFISDLDKKLSPVLDDLHAKHGVFSLSELLQKNKDNDNLGNDAPGLDSSL